MEIENSVAADELWSRNGPVTLVTPSLTIRYLLWGILLQQEERDPCECPLHHDYLYGAVQYLHHPGDQ